MPKNPVTTTSALLVHYSFDLDGFTAEQVVLKWLEDYPSKWVMAAVVEAIFQGRYKITSVDNILLAWSLNGRPQNHFDAEFADLVCSKLFKKIPMQPELLNHAENGVFVSPFNDSGHQPQVSTPIQSTLDTSNQPYRVSKEYNKGISKWLKFVTKL